MTLEKKEQKEKAKFPVDRKRSKNSEKKGSLSYDFPNERRGR